MLTGEFCAHDIAPSSPCTLSLIIAYPTPHTYMVSGALVLGDVHSDVLTALPPPITTPRSRVAPFYNVHLTGIGFGKELLDIDLKPFEQSYGTIIDSGTTFTYFPTEAYRKFSEAFIAVLDNIGLDVMMEDSVGTYCFVACVVPSHIDILGSYPEM